MRVKRDFDEIYGTQEDPWSIGAADDDRYDLLRSLLLEAAHERGSILDIGCGFGAFLARFEGEFESLTGIELSEVAVDKGRARFPRIEFFSGSASALEQVGIGQRRFDAIVFSDVIYYLEEAARRRALDWIATHLADDGVALVAGWCPGGDYLEPDELARLVDRSLAVEHERFLESEHLVLVGRRKRSMAALTLDYETWQPIPEGRAIDWEADVVAPTAALLDAADRTGAVITLFAEVGELIWLRQNEPEVAKRIAAQLRDAHTRGHDVQLHLHPTWLPELDARRDDSGWSWNWAYSRADDYPGDLTELIGRCCETLRDAVGDPGYWPSVFRAGAYEAQPFERLHAALLANGISCDSSVYAGGVREGRSYDYRLAASEHQPYLASRFDPQIEAPPCEQDMLELPIQTLEPAARWSFDATDGLDFAQRFLSWRRASRDERPSERYRMRKRLARRLATAQRHLRPTRRRFVPTGLTAEPARRRFAGHDYHVLIGHSKADLDVPAIERELARLRAAGVEMVSMRLMADVARRDVAATRSRPRWVPVGAQKAGVAALREVAPPDVARVVVVDLEARPNAAEDAPGWQQVERVDAAALRELRGAQCIAAPSGVETLGDPDAFLVAAHEALQPDGCLALAVWSDARAPERDCGEHPWRTAPGELALRLRAAGFAGVSVAEVDAVGELGLPSHAAAEDRLTIVRAWKRPAPAGPLDRATALASWVYEHLDPAQPQSSDDPFEVLESGHAWCAGYNLVTGRLLEREGYKVGWVSMRANDHPRGRGPERIDSHEVLVVDVDGVQRVLDPMANVLFDASLPELLADPTRADTDRTADTRYAERGYDLYATSFWYMRVKELAIRKQPRGEPQFETVSDFLAQAKMVSRQDSKRSIGHL
jgi:SAM-dependent methyltransferase